MIIIWSMHLGKRNKSWSDAINPTVALHEPRNYCHITLCAQIFQCNSMPILVYSSEKLCRFQRRPGFTTLKFKRLYGVSATVFSILQSHLQVSNKDYELICCKHQRIISNKEIILTAANTSVLVSSYGCWQKESWVVYVFLYL